MISCSSSCGDDHDRDGAHGAHHPERLIAAKVRQPEVKQDEVGRRLQDTAERRHRAGGRRHRVPVLGEHADQRAANRRVVLYHQKLGHESENIPFHGGPIGFL